MDPIQRESEFMTKSRKKSKLEKLGRKVIDMINCYKSSRVSIK